MTLPEAFNLALQHHQSGRLAEAESIYRQILAADPRHAESLHFLGVIAHQVGRNDLAADLIRQAIALRPNFPAAYNNLGTALLAADSLNAAAEFLERAATSTDPAVRQRALYNLGLALSRSGDSAGAIASYRDALRSNPGDVNTHLSLADELRRAGQPAEALQHVNRAAELNPADPRVKQMRERLEKR